MIDDSELDRRLERRHDPEPVQTVQNSMADLLVVVQSGAGRKPSSRRRRIGLVGLAGIFALSGIVAAPAAAHVIGQLFAQTGRECVGTECGDAGSEFIDSTAPDLSDYVAQVYPEWLPLAPAMTRSSVIERVIVELQAAPGDHTALGVQSVYEKLAYCGWVDVWLTANKAGDVGLRADATAVMNDEPTWPARVATDGGGIVEMQQRFAAGASAGNLAIVQDAHDSSGCGIMPTFAP